MEFDLATIALILVIVGALNWGVIAATNESNDLVKLVGNPTVEKGVKLLVGASGLYLLWTLYEKQQKGM